MFLVVKQLGTENSMDLVGHGRIGIVAKQDELLTPSNETKEDIPKVRTNFIVPRRQNT
jgi:hypothetical protein